MVDRLSSAESPEETPPPVPKGVDDSEHKAPWVPPAAVEIGIASLTHNTTGDDPDAEDNSSP